MIKIFKHFEVKKYEKLSHPYKLTKDEENEQSC